MEIRYTSIPTCAFARLVILRGIFLPFQIIIRLTFFTASFATHFIQKLVQNTTSFVVACFINKSSLRMT